MVQLCLEEKDPSQEIKGNFRYHKSITIARYGPFNALKGQYLHLYQFIPDKLAHDVDNAPAVRWKELVGPLIKWNHLDRKYFLFF